MSVKDSLTLLGKKMGMTRVFTQSGDTVAASVIQILSNRIVNLKTKEKENYNAIQFTVGLARKNKLNKATMNHFLKSYEKAEVDVENQTIGEKLFESRVESIEEFKVGDVIDVSYFQDVSHIDVSSVNIGKGFQGGIKRHNFRSQDASHGNSVSHRVLGSIGQNQTPGRVFKGKKMAGHMGAKKCTNINLKVLKVDSEKGLILVNGSVPGYTGTDVMVRIARKRTILAS